MTCDAALWEFPARLFSFTIASQRREKRSPQPSSSLDTPVNSASTDTAPAATSPPLAGQIVDYIDRLVSEAEKMTRPMEIDPYRSRLFELFVVANGAGYTQDGADPDLTADGLGRQLAARWNLAEAARMSVQSQTKLSPEQLAKMRMMWSVMRLWMEWNYAWDRWEEFHRKPEVSEGEPA
jgi:hypothetical protein